MKDEIIGDKKARLVNSLLWDNLTSKGRKKWNKQTKKTDGMNRKQEADWNPAVLVVNLSVKDRQF